MEGFSKQIIDRAERPRCIGSLQEKKILFSQKDLGLFEVRNHIKNSNGLVILYGKVELSDEKKKINQLYFLTNVKGPSLAFIDGMVELCCHKNYFDLESMVPNDVEKILRDDPDKVSFPMEAISMYRFFEVVEALKNYLKQKFPIERKIRCSDFSKLSNEQQYFEIEDIFNDFIRPPLRKDGGDLECLKIENDYVTIQYKGACGSCGSSETTTLDYIQSVLRRETGHPYLQVLAQN